MSRITISEAVVIGVKSPNGQVGGNFTPGNGTTNNMFTTTLAVINPKYYDRNGELQEKKETLFVTIFSTKTTDHASIAAKYFSVGKRLKNLVLERNQYWSQAKDANGTPLTKADGTAFQIQKEGYTVLHYEMGRESNKLVEAEVAAWNGQFNFGSRPPFWNGLPGMGYLIAMGLVPLQLVEEGKRLWKELSAARAATVYQPGMTMFGYAQVRATAHAAAPVQQPLPSVGYTGANIPGFNTVPATAPSMAGFAGNQLGTPAPTVGAGEAAGM